ncbi:MAG: RNA-directed DNA polymerase [Deltaproteobacteria bacterium]|nr:RNA-directed DNA polymerase [Deltaproteobacteria bacterium]MCW5804856.1 RNA-directed DNA polymerase [Deltaproteobacteria bacterium]
MTEPALTWADVAAAGGIREWVDAEVARQGLASTGVPPNMTDAEKKLFKARRDEERRVRKELYKRAWSAYKRAHIVHLGPGVFWHDTADVDRFDADDPEKKRQDNALPKLADVEAFAKAVGVDIPRLRWLSYHREVDSGTHYRRWTVPKRDGTARLISAPKPDLKRIQRWITTEVTEHLPVHGAAHGFITGRSIVSNARVHAGAHVVVKLDIRGFYPTVTMRRVKGLLRRAGLGEQVATLMALLATESPREEVETHGKVHYVAIGPRSLPQGAPTSPSITNALCLRLDCRLAGLARKLGCRYTRYADDLTFSWHGDGKAAIGSLLRATTMIVRAEGFEIHTKKTRVMRKGARQKVTGLVVNEAQGRPTARVPRTTQRELRAAIRNRELGRPGKGESLEELKGMAAFIMMTDRERGRAFMERIDKLIAAREVK